MGLHGLLISVFPNTVWVYQEKDSFRTLTARKHFTCYIMYYLISERTQVSIKDKNKKKMKKKKKKCFT